VPANVYTKARILAKEHEDIYVTIAEKYALDCAHTFTLMKHKKATDIKLKSNSQKPSQVLNCKIMLTAHHTMPTN